MKLLNKQTQGDHVIEDQGMVEEERHARLRLPGIENLHLKSFAEIAQALTTALKSRSGVVDVHYKVGEYIDIIYTG